MEAADLLTRSRIENEVLSEMAGLTSTSHPYDDVVHGLLDLIEHVVSSPFLSVSIRELEGVAHYVRMGREADRSWGEGVAEGVAKTWDPILQVGSHAVAGTQHHSISAPAAWVMSFTARSRSGRLGSLVIAAQAPLALSMIDVEGLDSINRIYGRRYGNHILQKLAGMLQSSVRLLPRS